MVHDDVEERLHAVAAQLSCPGGADGLRALLEGVSAAPLATDPLAWTDLAEGGLGADQRQDLETLRRRLMAQPRLDAEVPAADRIPAFRTAMERLNLDGFIVPRADEHQGEAVPARSERLSWLTGFSGSAGIAVVLSDVAALFVDGRYTLQGSQQTDPEYVDCRPIAEERPEAWIVRMAAEGARIGFDPWLHTVNQIRRMEEVLGGAGVHLVAVDENPIDLVWTGRPAAPIAPIRLHPVALAGREAADKLAEVAAEIAAAKTDSVLLSAPDSIAWLFNIRGGDVPNTPVALGFAEIDRDGGATLFVDPRKFSAEVARELSQVVTIRAPGDLDQRLDALATAGKRVMLDPDQDPVRFDRRLRGGGADVIHRRDPCVGPKARKTATELDGARAAHVRDGVAICRLLAWIDDQVPGGGVTELSAVERLAAFRREVDGFTGPSFDTISGVGPHGAIVHYRVTPESSRPLTEGTLYLVDSGGQYIDGTTDITRTVALGPPTDSMRRHYTLVLKGHLALSALRFPPRTAGAQIDAIARHALWNEGLDYDHGTGHGIGSYLGVHEGPQRIAKAGAGVPLEAGMIVSNEPGLYIEGEYGIRIENLIVVTPPDTHPETSPETRPEPGAGGSRPMHAFETLTLAPYDSRLIDTALLSPFERAQVDAYHARVRDVLAPEIEDTAARDWLIAATRPL